MADAAVRTTLLRAPLAICHLSADGAIVYANPAFALLLGYASPEELMADRNGRSMFHAESVCDSPAALAAGRLSFEAADAILCRRDGTSVLVTVDGTTYEEEGGAAGSWILFARESGREKQRETELARTLAELENTMQTIPDILYTLDVEARLVRWNRKLETASGYSENELRSRPGFELFPESQKKTFAKAIMDAFATGYAEFETQLLARDGRTIPYQWTAVPLEDATGNVIGVAGAGRDISEWKKNEEARASLEALVRNRAREWQLTFDAIESPIVIASEDGAIVRLNRAARDLIGDVPFPEIVGRNLVEYADREPWAAFLRLSRERGDSLQAYDAFSGLTWLIARSRFSFSRHGEAEGERELSILIARDITRMLELQETARKNEIMSAVGQLIVGVAHEVRNPIFGISATLDAFEASFAVDEESRQFIEVLRGEIGRLSELMQELLDYGKPARMELHPDNVAGVIADATRACERTAGRAGVRIDNRVPPDLPAVPIDRGRLAQVFQNLIENAVQFSPADGTVILEAEVTTHDEAECVAVSVLDAGRGFNPADIGRIFEPFFTRRRGGTGLGLSIVQRIVDEHHGSIEAANRPTGGARMTVFLPLARRI